MSLDPITAGIDFVSKIADKIFPDPAAKADAMLKLEELKQSGELAQLTSDTDIAKGQLAINQVEAASTNGFVSNWRPFIGWVCGSAFAYSYIIQPFLMFWIYVAGYKVEIPNLDMGALNTVLLGVLGINGGFRTYEKIKGVTK